MAHGLLSNREWRAAFLSLVVACGLCSLQHAGSLVEARNLSSCGMQVLLPHGMWDLSSLTRGRTLVPCIVRRILYHWTIREVPMSEFLKSDFFSISNRVLSYCVGQGTSVENANSRNGGFQEGLAGVGRGCSFSEQPLEREKGELGGPRRRGSVSGFLFSFREMGRQGERQASAEASGQGWNPGPRMSRGSVLRPTSKASRSLAGRSGRNPD